jgi:RecA-family ATPase/5S rRNA maturation endonuclease (ribonuclease M5)
MNVSQPAYTSILDKLRAAGTTVNANGNKARAKCPAHNGKSNTSLSLTASRGMVLMHCHAGCDTADVLSELGLTPSALFDNPRGISYPYPDGRIVDRTPTKKFRQRGNTKGTALYGQERIAQAETVYVPEGEKDVDAIESVGGAAVCSAGGACNAHKADWTPLRDKHVVIIADNDEPGQKHAQQVSELLTGIATSEIVKSAVGKDVSDHIAAGKNLADLVPVSLLDRLSVTSEWLNKQSFPELEFAVPGLISEGLGLLVAPPKKGKSFLVGNLAIAVAAGGKALGHIPVKQRPVLVLALEDGHRRLQDRYTKINDDQPIPPGVTFITKATPQECLAVIAEYLDRYRDQKPLIILDTLGKVKQARRSGDEAFQADYALGTKFKNLADTVPGSTILIIHHTRKADAADFVDLVSGTQGLAGSVDFVLALDRKRHENDAILSVTGRDITEGEYALIAECGFIWRLDGANLAEAASRADEKRDQATESARLRKLGPKAQEVLRLVNERGHVTPADVAFKVKLVPKRASELLNRLADSDFIVKASRGEYHSIRYAAQSESAECAESEDSSEKPENGKTFSPGNTAHSAHTAHSSDTAHSADVVSIGSRRHNTCRCGASLKQQTSIKRGVCAECWSEGVRQP